VVTRSGGKAGRQLSGSMWLRLLGLLMMLQCPAANALLLIA
jgi:hypothetical protein